MISKASASGQQRIHRALGRDSKVIGYSIPKPTHAANEDAMAFRRVHTSRGEAWMLAVADGVSTSEWGRDAAKFVVASLWSAAFTIVGASDPADALRRQILSIHGATRSKFNGKGLASVVVAIVFERKRTILHASVGDSLVCIFDGREYRQVNTEDMVTLVRRMNSDPVLVGGCPIIDRAISQGIGIEGNVTPHIGIVGDLMDGSLIGLASDGINSVRLGSFLEEVSHMPSQDQVAQFCVAEMKLKHDDTTLLLARLSKRAEFAEIERRLISYGKAAISERDEIIALCNASRCFRRLSFFSCSPAKKTKTAQYRSSDFSVEVHQPQPGRSSFPHSKPRSPVGRAVSP